ncbi:EF-hand domain-containing protein [Acidobacteria bacterium AH-259-O06]|nr:EF-hand domain-containing protein [Acidobacteria bacterium AH-259-O06]
METIQRDYAPKGVHFYYIYKALAHPERNGYVSPFTLQERLMHVQEAKRRLGSKIHWLCDTMSNDLKHALGNGANSEFVIDPDGVVVSRRAWSDPKELRKDLEELVGPVEKPTQVSDLGMDLKLQPPSDKIHTGIVPRVQVPGRMVPLKIQPVIEEKGAPFYVKLRAEVKRPFLSTGKGKLYLGFHLDRLYEVHWNNLTKPLEFELESPEGVQVMPIKGVGPKVEEAADKDPREFLLDISSENFNGPIDLTVRYFACDDANTFCIPLKQQYAIHLERDIDGGTARRGSGRVGRSGDFQARLWERDQDGDGKLSLEEVPEPLKRRFRFMDANGDGFIDEEELQAMPRRRGAGPGFGGQFIERMLRNDSNGDGKISREEAPEPMLRRFDGMDSNGDGFIDEKELRARGSRFRRRSGPRQ